MFSIEVCGCGVQREPCEVRTEFLFGRSNRPVESRGTELFDPFALPGPKRDPPLHRTGNADSHRVVRVDRCLDNTVIIVNVAASPKEPDDQHDHVPCQPGNVSVREPRVGMKPERFTVAKARVDAIEEQGVQVNVLPDEVQNKLVATAQAMWDEEGKRSENAKKALDMLKGYLADLGYL